MSAETYKTLFRFHSIHVCGHVVLKRNLLYYVNGYSYPLQCSMKTIQGCWHSTMSRVCVVFVFSQAIYLVPGNAPLVNVTVTEVATFESTATNQTVVTFVIAFTKNTTLVENFTTAIKEPSIALNYVQAVIPAGTCVLCVHCVVHSYNTYNIRIGIWTAFPN